VLRRVESRGVLETAHRLMNYCGNIYRYAVATGRAERDISSDLRGALPQKAFRFQDAEAKCSLTDIRTNLVRDLHRFESALVHARISRTYDRVRASMQPQVFLADSSALHIRVERVIHSI